MACGRCAAAMALNKFNGIPSALALFCVLVFVVICGTCLVVLCSSSAASVCLLGPKIRGTRVHMHLLDHRNQYQIKMASLSASNVVAQLPKLRV